MSAVALRPDDRVHLIGICGAGMSALARVLLERGYRVTGSDLRGGRECSALSAMGARVSIGHDAAAVDGADLVVHSTAVPAGNAERVRAGELGLPVLRRPQLLELLLRGRRRVLVTGTHGKTTTTAMTTVCLQSAGLDPSFAIGGTVTDAGTSAHDGTGDVFVAEADEAYRSFLSLTPDCAVVLNLELDHHDEYADIEELTDAFVTFLDRRTRGGPAVLCADDPGARGLGNRVGGPILLYGEHPEAALRITHVEQRAEASTFHLSEDGQELGEFSLRVPGRHNVLNAAAAVAAARWGGADVEAIRHGLVSFSGAQRRFQRLGVAAGVTVIDDYAHHPTELSATIAAARQTLPSGRVIAAFQPHRYSRTSVLGPALGRALAAADVVVVTDVYAAGEAPVPGVTGALVAEAARAGGPPTYLVPAAGDLPALLAGLAAQGDLVLTLGAGDITEAGPQLLRLLGGGDG